MLNLKKKIQKTLIFFISSISLSWTSVTTISDAGINFSPFIAQNNSGNCVIVWTNGDFPDYSIQSSIYDGSSWSAVSSIITSGIPISPISTMDSSGNIVVAWESISGSNRSVLTRRKSVGFPWDTPLTLSTSSSNSYTSLATNPAGQSIFGWVDSENDVVQVASLNFGDSWSSVSTISTTGGYKVNLSLGIDLDGNGIVTWEEANTGILYVSKTTSGFDSSWSTPAALTSGGVNTGPSLSVAPNGNAIVAWTNIDTYEIVASIYESGSWTSPAVISDGYGAFPSTATSGTEYFVSWNDQSFGDTKASVCTLGSWESPFNLSANTPNDPPKTTFKSGIFLTAWTDLVTGQVYVANYPFDGSSPSPVIISEEDTSFDLYPRISSSAVMTVSAWEAIIDSDHLIQLNVN